MTKPTKVTAMQAATMIELRNHKGAYGRKGYRKSSGACCLGFNKAEQRWTMGAMYYPQDAEGYSIKTGNPLSPIEVTRARHTIAFEGTGPEAMERLNAHWKGFCANNSGKGSINPRFRRKVAA